MKNKALFAVLSHKFKDGEIIFLDDLSFKAPKTKDAKNVITSLAKVKEFGAISRRNNSSFIAAKTRNRNLFWRAQHYLLSFIFNFKRGVVGQKKTFPL